MFSIFNTIKSGRTIEALEEVEERVIVQLYATHYEHVFLSKRKDEHSNQIGWTEQEREDIEKFLNVFGSWEDMATRIDETMANWGAIPNDYRHFFDELLKEQGCDKK